jgi:hypothetical protein
VNKMNYALLARTIDTEGSIGIRRSVQKHAAKTGMPIYSYTASFRVHNTDVRLLDWCKKYFGGQIYKGHSKWNDAHGKKNWKLSNEWMLCLGNRRGEQLILSIMPYLLLKMKQAKLCLEFVRISHGRIHVYQPEERERMWAEMKVLNKRGLTPTTNTPDASQEVKIESDLTGDRESDLLVTANVQ